MNDFSDSDAIGELGYLLSPAERKLAATVVRALADPGLSWRAPGPWRRVQIGAGDFFEYRPDFLIRNKETGRTLALELQAPLSLSLPNRMKYKALRDAYRDSGEEFLVLIDGKEEGAPARWLRNDNIRTTWIGGADEARESAIREAVLAAL